ncbi:TonB-dependent receptor plug domain-containing protein [Pseudofulvibacter geojedonensis]|uniref:TonB-dependent receptor plug domain-containing protein n=1 Tax=Pseudofulvibacter geojedonensis TaxID=1123758 RepID=A0ABW3HZA1_9FLAO
MNKKVLSLLGMAFIGCAVYAQEKTQDSVAVEQLETVELDTKFKLDREKSGKVIYKITQKDLEKVQGQSLAQTINTVSGIEITGARSNQGRPLSYRVRGGKNNQVVILIDGIQVNDPSSIGSEFNLNLIDVNNIESIEIIKGGVSTLYGAGAATSVISITTKKATDKKVAGTVFMSTGSNRAVVTDKYELNTANVGANINGTINKFTYFAAVSTENAKGISAKRSDDDSVVYEDDPFERENASIRLGYNFSEKFNVTTFANYNKASNQYDNSWAPIDVFNEAVTENVQFGLNSEYKYNKGNVVVNAIITETDIARSSSYKQEYSSNTIVMDLYNKYKFSKKLWAVLGVNFQEQKASQAGGFSSLTPVYTKDDTKITLVDPYLNLTYFTDFGLTVNAGVRMNNHSKYGNHFVYSINPSYNFEATDKLNVKVFATGSTAFIAPSLYQLYGPYGDEDLDPQESIGGEAGFELNYNKKYRLSVVAFHREEQNKLNFTNLYDNLGNWIGGTYLNLEDDNIKIQGLEVETKLVLAKNLDLNANYTFTQFESDPVLFDSNELNLEVAKHKANANLSYVLKEKTNLSLAYQFVDDRFAYGGSRLDAYKLVNFFISHQLTDNLELNGSLTNVFDEDYQEINTYSTLGRNYKLGLRLKF